MLRELFERDGVKVGITITHKGAGQTEIQDDLSVGLIREILLFGRLNLQQLHGSLVSFLLHLFITLN